MHVFQFSRHKVANKIHENSEPLMFPNVARPHVDIVAIRMHAMLF